MEGSGEVRVFANPLPLFQALVRPLHDWVMNVLRRLPTDGTYNPRPLLGQSNLFSFDLKAATDSLPVDLSGGVLFSLFGRRLAESWIWILCAFGFRLPEKGPSPNYMSSGLQRVNLNGFYSSWRLCSHSRIICWCGMQHGGYALG